MTKNNNDDEATTVNAKMNVFLWNLLVVRAEKTDRRLNQADDHASSVDSIETCTVLEEVDRTSVRDCCSLLAYYLKIVRGFEYVDFTGTDDLTTDDQRAQFDTFNRVVDFEQYAVMCREMIENVMRNGKRVFALLEEEKKQRNSTKVEGESETPPKNKRAKLDDDVDDDNSVLVDDVYSAHSLVKNMGGLFNRFHEIFADNECMPIETIYERLFVSSCMSKRAPLPLRLEHLSDANSLTSMLTRAVVANTDTCNTLFEAFFGTGILFTSLLNIITNEYNGEDDGTNQSRRRLRYWTRVRMHNPDDVAAAHFLKDVHDPVYRRTLAQLPPELFDAASGRDVLLTKGDTLCTMFVQFVGRIHLRLYEWIEREDVQRHVVDHFVCKNLQALFAQVGRGQDQRSWIRFFKRTNDRRSKLYIKLDPLLQLNDEITVHGETGGKRTASTTMTSTGQQLKSTVPPATAHQYATLRDFKQRYDKFMYTGNNALFELWNERRTKFLRETERTNAYHVDEARRGIAQRLRSDSSPLLSFEVWCTHVNQLLFPYNFLLLSGEEAIGSDVRASESDVSTPRYKSFDAETLGLAWTLKCQEYLRVTRSKCEQILRFMETIEVKSRMFIEEKNFVMLFGDATRNMTFLYDLVRDFMNNEDQQTETEDVEMT